MYNTILAWNVYFWGALSRLPFFGKLFYRPYVSAARTAFRQYKADVATDELALIPREERINMATELLDGISAHLKGALATEGLENLMDKHRARRGLK